MPEVQPAPARGKEGHTYIVEFSDGTIKVGFSKKPSSRLKQHKTNAACFGISIIQTWFSEPHIEANDNEQIALKWSASRASEVRAKEWFVGIVFTDIKAMLDALPKNRYTDEEYAAYKEDIKARGSKIFHAIGLPDPASTTRKPLDKVQAEQVAKLARITLDSARWVLSNDDALEMLQLHLDHFLAHRCADDCSHTECMDKWHTGAPGGMERWEQLQDLLLETAAMNSYDITVTELGRTLCRDGILRYIPPN